MNNIKRAYVYVDGFNLFYACLKGSPYKWLDLNKLISFYFPKYKIEKIKYFTAIVNARKNDLNKPARQLAYLRALKTLDNLEVILGTFLENEIKVFVPDKNKKNIRQIAGVELNNNKIKLPLMGNNYFFIKKTEEKGSDVNIASHLIIDAYENKFDVAIVISNDSDLADAIKILNHKNNKSIRLLNPYQKTNLKLLDSVFGNVKKIRESVLKISQFPEILEDNNGYFYKPKDWNNSIKNPPFVKNKDHQKN
jgi:uncharacterized LabA/DUF88 family protein